MTISNVTVCITENENDIENHAPTQAKEMVEKSQENEKHNITEKNNEPKWSNPESVVATSTVPRDVILDMKEIQPAKSEIKNNIIYRLLFTNLRRKNNKQRKEEMQRFQKKEKQHTAWVQYSLGHGRGSYWNGSNEGIDYQPGQRSNFIIIVLAIVTFLMSLTALFVYIVYTNEDLREIFRYPSIFFVVFVVGGLLSAQLCFTCVPSARTSPVDLILLIIVLITLSCLVALVTVRYSTTILLHAFIITAGVTLFCLLLALTSFDFTSFWLYVFAISVAFSLAVMTMTVSSAITGEYYKIPHMITLFVGVIIQVAFLIMELQAIIGGKSIELDEGAYILGAYLLYTTIVSLFLHFVRILGLFADD